MTGSSLLPTASLLCAFEKVGYGRLVFEAPGEAVEARRSISGTMGTDILRLEEECDCDDEDCGARGRSRVLVSRSLSLDDERCLRVERRRSLSLDSGLSRSRSRSRSESFLRRLRSVELANML